MAKLVRAILATPEAADFETVADVVAALKWRCAQLQIGWTNDAIGTALRLVASNTRLPRPGRTPRRLQQWTATHRHDPRPISQAEAAVILKRLGVQL